MQNTLSELNDAHLVLIVLELKHLKSERGRAGGLVVIEAVSKNE